MVVGGLELVKDKAPEVDKLSARLDQLMIDKIDNPKSIAKAINSSSYSSAPNKSPETIAKQQEAFTKLVNDAERVRQNSIYVDFDHDLKVVARPHNFKKSDYDTIRRDVVLAKYHIEKLSGLKPSKEVLYSTFPEWKGELEKSIKELASSLESYESKKGGSG